MAATDCGDGGVDTKKKLVEILRSKHVVKHFVLRLLKIVFKNILDMLFSKKPALCEGVISTT